MASKQQMQRLLEHYDTCLAMHEAWWEAGARMSSPPQTPPFPEELRDLRCEAKTRAGTPCKQKTIYGNGRCKFHGGLATGPTTDAGKEQARINGRKGGRPRKQVSNAPENRTL